MYFLVLLQQSYLLGLYGPVLLCLLSNTLKYSPSCKGNTENNFFQYCSLGEAKNRMHLKNIYIISVLWLELENTVKYSLSPWDFALGNSLGIYCISFSFVVGIIQMLYNSMKSKPARQAARRPFTNPTPPTGKINPFTKTAIHFELVMQFWCPLRFRMS